MSETETKTPTETPQENSGEKTSCKSSGCCGPHTPLYISIAALLLAAYAAITAGAGSATDVEKRLTSLDNQIAHIDNQLVNLDKDVQSNRESLIQTKLQKAILNLQEIGHIAGAETKATISEVEQMLRALTSAVINPESTPATESEAPADESATADTVGEAVPADEPAATAAEVEPAAEVAPETPLDAAPATEETSETVQEGAQAF